MHTFCAECLNSYITSDCKTGDKKGLICPVCKTFIKPPLKGMLTCSWAYNFPLNFALNGLVNEMKAKHKSLRTAKQAEQNAGTGSMVETKCVSHPDRVIEFQCLDHCDSFCSVCAALLHRKCEQINFLGYAGDEGKMPKHNYKSKDDSSHSRKIHRSIIRLSKSFDEGDQTVPKSIDPNVLTSDFALARSIVGTNETFPKVVGSRENANDESGKYFHHDEIVNKEAVNERPVIHTRKSLTRLHTSIKGNEKKDEADDMDIPQSQEP
jgi:hypothetical protein